MARLVPRPRLAHVLLVITVGAVGALVACTLNPQPLPPGDDNGATDFGDAGSRSEAGTFNPGSGPQDAAPGNANDAALPSNDGDGGDAGDGDAGSDAGDSGDAG